MILPILSSDSFALRDSVARARALRDGTTYAPADCVIVTKPDALQKAYARFAAERYAIAYVEPETRYTALIAGRATEFSSLVDAVCFARSSRTETAAALHSMLDAFSGAKVSA